MVDCPDNGPYPEPFARAHQPVEGTLPLVRPAYDLEGHAEFIHNCNGVLDKTVLRNRYEWPLTGPESCDGWSYDGYTDTVSPSINCLVCGTHGYWVNGEWQPA